MIAVLHFSLQPGVISLWAARAVQGGFPHNFSEGRVGVCGYGLSTQGGGSWSAHVSEASPGETRELPCPVHPG